MVDVLGEIVARKRREVSARLAGPVEAPRTTRSLRTALERPGARFIMEVKPRSPSGHVARHSPRAAVHAYAPFADAISVLTDRPDFGGSLDLLAEMRGRFDGPILAKDFIVDPAQVSEARAHGADAVLCMLSVLDDDAAGAVMAEADRLAMDVLVEVHDADELERALGLGARLVGINNRNLKTLETNLAVTRGLAPHVPADVTLVSESGFAGHRDVAVLAPLVDGFLVGSHLMAAHDIDAAVRALVFGTVKICGLTCAGDVMSAARCGATHAGFVLVPGTPRAIPPQHAALLSRIARANAMRSVAVFRNAPLGDVVGTVRMAGFGAVQLHGSEDTDYIATLRDRLPKTVEIWTARQVGDASIAAQRPADRSLFDSGRGGSGRAFDWALLDGQDDLADAMLAGGIAPTNAAAARALGAFGLDVGSAVESRPGRKDPASLAALFAALRAPDRRAAS